MQNGVIFLPASKAPQLAVLPGYGLLEELALLVHMGLPATDVLTNATSVAASVLGIDPIQRKLAILEQDKHYEDEKIVLKRKGAAY